MANLDPEVLKVLIRDSGLSYKQNHKSYIFTCPRCHKKKLYIRKTNGVFTCFRCDVDGFKGAAQYALAELLGQSVREVERQLYGEAGAQTELFLVLNLVDFFGDDDEVDADAREVPRVPWPDDFFPIDHPKSESGLKYLEGRGIPRWLALKYGLRYCPMKRRVIFPIANTGGLYGWQERLIVSEKWVDESGEEGEVSKIVTSWGTPKERLLMFADRISGSDHAILCEGPVDALKAHFCGGNVCSMGKKVSREQIQLLLGSGIKKLYLALDPDAARETQKIVKELFGQVELYEIRATGKEGEKTDLGAMTFEAVHDAFMNATQIGAGHLFSYLEPGVIPHLR